MSNVIQFLDAMGRKPLSSAAYAASVAALEIDEAQREALLRRDPIALSGLLGGREQLRCAIFATDGLQS